jgi:hypothetical protein
MSRFATLAMSRRRNRGAYRLDPAIAKSRAFEDLALRSAWFHDPRVEARGRVSSDEREPQLQGVTIGPLDRLDGSVCVALQAYDPRWPEQFRREAERFRAATGERVLELQHVGSTAVPGLVAKWKLDVLLVVADRTSVRTSRRSRPPAPACASASSTGTSTGCTRDRTSRSTSRCSARVARRSSACCACATIVQIASSTPAPRGPWQRAIGATCRTMQARRPRWSRRSFGAQRSRSGRLRSDCGERAACRRRRRSPRPRSPVPSDDSAHRR